MQTGDVEVAPESFWRQWRCLFGFVAQTAYVYVFLALDQQVRMAHGRVVRLLRQRRTGRRRRARGKLYL